MLLGLIGNRLPYCCSYMFVNALLLLSETIPNFLVLLVDIRDKAIPYILLIDFRQSTKLWCAETVKGEFKFE